MYIRMILVHVYDFIQTLETKVHIHVLALDLEHLTTWGLFLVNESVKTQLSFCEQVPKEGSNRNCVYTVAKTGI